MSSTALYLMLALGIVFQGEVALLSAGSLIYAGKFKFWAVVLLATLLSTLNGEIFFTLAKVGSKISFVQKKINESLNKPLSLIKRYRAPLLLFSRFAYGIRNGIPLAFGLTNINRFEFSILNFLGALIWALTFATLGLFSAKALAVFTNIKKFETIFILVIFGTAFLYALLKFFKNENKLR